MAAILVVDDEEDIRELVGIYLKNEGFKVYKAADGQEAPVVQDKTVTGDADTETEKKE